MTGWFIVEHGQNADFPNQNFSIQHDQRTLSGNPSDIDDKNVYARSDLPSDKKRHNPFNYEVNTILIESISWQWLYATNFLIAYERTQTTRDTSPSSKLYSRPLLEAVVAVGWLLNSYWNPDSPLFNPIERRSAFMLTQEDHPFAPIAVMFGSGYDQQRQQPTASSDRQASKASLRSGGSFSSPVNTDYGDSDDKGGPEKHLHTLDFHCFIYPCHGVCRFRPLSDSRGTAEWALDFQNSLSMDGAANTNDAAESLDDDMARFWNLSSTSRDFEVINGVFDPQCLLEDRKLFIPPNHSETQPTTTESSQLDQSQHHLSETGTVQATAHIGQKVCDAIIIGKDGQQRLCGKICKNARARSSHKSKLHTGQKTCQVTVITEDGQPRPCGIICKNNQSLMNHKRSRHSEQQNCKLTVVGKDGKQQPCGRLFKSARAMSDHKTRFHGGQKTCNVIMIGEDGQQRPCGKVCINVNTLRHHKGKYHGRQRTCDMTVIGDDGQPRPCGAVCKSAQALSEHKRIHRKRKPVVVQNDDLHSQEGKVKK
ncbi:hypothetical protein [Endozoicomonas sp. 8E]|uniref:hypothetical protein n=1 Tax=Endozoicomonas sp. 8E TaxID=3035692 RepID=UPI0029391083|nr:hypothetical protein [Endozoicomonas sp. 8E]WOG26950.1 hypothetical protein P6910_20730 [Endozoicomonas sp. 8E]